MAPIEAMAGSSASLTQLPDELTTVMNKLGPTMLQNLEPLSMLGYGAYAQVLEVRDSNSGTKFALKVVEKKPLQLRGMIKQLAREFGVQRGLHHPNIVGALEIAEDEVYAFLLLPLCTGGSAWQATLRFPNNIVPEPRSARWLRDCVLGLAYLHDMGLVHRDVKLENLLLDKEGNARLCDFGWCAFESEKPHGMCGTPQLAPPEVDRGDPQTAKVDMWGVGVCLIQLLTGRAYLANENDTLPQTASANAQEIIAGLLAEDSNERLDARSAMAQPLLMQAEPPPVSPLQPLSPAPLTSPITPSSADIQVKWLSPTSNYETVSPSLNNCWNDQVISPNWCKDQGSQFTLNSANGDLSSGSVLPTTSSKQQGIAASQNHKNVLSPAVQRNLEVIHTVRDLSSPPTSTRRTEVTKGPSRMSLDSRMNVAGVQCLVRTKEDRLLTGSSPLPTAMVRQGNDAAADSRLVNTVGGSLGAPVSAECRSSLRGAQVQPAQATNGTTAQVAQADPPTQVVQLDAANKWQPAQPQGPLDCTSQRHTLPAQLDRTGKNITALLAPVEGSPRSAAEQQASGLEYGTTRRASPERIIAGVGKVPANIRPVRGYSPERPTPMRGQTAPGRQTASSVRLTPYEQSATTGRAGVPLTSSNVAAESRTPAQPSVGQPMQVGIRVPQNTAYEMPSMSPVTRGTSPPSRSAQVRAASFEAAGGGVRGSANLLPGASEQTRAHRTQSGLVATAPALLGETRDVSAERPMSVVHSDTSTGTARRTTSPQLAVPSQASEGMPSNHAAGAALVARPAATREKSRTARSLRASSYDPPSAPREHSLLHGRPASVDAMSRMDSGVVSGDGTSLPARTRDPARRTREAAQRRALAAAGLAPVAGEALEVKAAAREAVVLATQALERCHRLRTQAGTRHAGAGEGTAWGISPTQVRENTAPCRLARMLADRVNSREPNAVIVS